MLCRMCGSDIEGKPEYCPVCGAPLQEEPEIKPKNKKKNIIIAACIFLIIAAAAAVGVYALLSAGRSKEKVLEQYMEAFNAGDDEKLIKLMFPKDSLDAATEYTSRMLGWNDTFRGEIGELDVTMKEEQSLEDAPDHLQEAVDEMLSDSLHISCKEITVASLDLSYARTPEEEKVTKKLNNILLYQVDKKWYVLPGWVDLVQEDRRQADIGSAGSIANALTVSMSVEEVYNSAASYFDTVIPLSDMQYMPGVFVENFRKNLEADPEIQHDADGAAGYAFMIESNGSVHVYISSEQYVNAWEIYPQVADGYELGQLADDADKISTKSSSYAYLISSQSPMLGYWQADNAGVYIGYNTSGGTEGLMVYYLIDAEGIVERYDTIAQVFGWTMTDADGQVRFDQNDMAYTCQLGYSEDGTLTMQINDLSLTLTSGEITNGVRQQYAGEWISCYDGESTSLQDIGNLEELTVCATCGYVHADYDAEKLHGSSSVVELYDGKNIQYMMVDPAVYQEDKYTGWNSIEYSIREDNKLVCNRHSGGVPGIIEGNEYIRTDSEEGKKMKQAMPALKAYEAALSGHEREYQYALIYINGDDIPELYCNTKDFSGRMILAYNSSTGEAYTAMGGGMTDAYSYREREGILYYYHGMHQIEERAYYQMSDDGTSCNEISSATAVYDGGYSDCSIDGQPVDVQTYTDYDKRYGELTDCGESKLYDSIWDAYVGA